VNASGRPNPLKLPTRQAERPWRRPMTEVAGLVLGVVVFSWLYNLAGKDVASATANAHAVLSVERSLHLNIELPANHWLAEHPVLMHGAVAYYRLYYLPLAGVILWLLLRHADVYRTIRRTLLVMAPLALLVVWLVPMSPPRFALAGIVDIVAEHDLFNGGGSRNLANGHNHFSAMPSLHVGWSALCAYGMWLAARGKHPRLALLSWLFPVVMVAVVITTGNHYVLDVAGSLIVLATSIMVVAAWERWAERRHIRTQAQGPPATRSAGSTTPS
jgi:membrane-associated phospholipid phosphatase